MPAYCCIELDLLLTYTCILHVALCDSDCMVRTIGLHRNGLFNDDEESLGCIYM